MKSLTTGLVATALIGLMAVWSVSGAPEAPSSPSDLSVEKGAQNPWTSLELNNERDSFQFAVISDRTGGHRPGVFGKAVERINLLQPEFVMSVGDLIEGYNDDPGQWAIEWAEFESKIDILEMPFFFCAGNHDLTNIPMRENWKRKFGRTYYDFRYRDVLFLVIDSEDPPINRDPVPYRISPEQQQWAADVLANNADVRWTFVFLHKPCWSYPANTDHKALGWTGIEDALQGRNYTVFSGHKHNYAKFYRKGMEYYMLATTGGGSKLRGYAEGEFDHFTWVTMKSGKPVIANIMLDGVEDSNIRVLPDPETQAKPAAK